MEDYKQQGQISEEQQPEMTETGEETKLSDAEEPEKAVSEADIEESKPDDGVEPEEAEPEPEEAEQETEEAEQETEEAEQETEEAESEPEEAESETEEAELESKEAELKPEEAETEPESSEEDSQAIQAVTLDDIHDSETVLYVNKVKRTLEQLEEAQKDKSRLSGELKQCEKAYSSMEKSVAEGITVALKKRKEEIAATYDKELSQYQDQIDVCKTERAKAKASAIAQRIQVETAPLNQQNQQLEAQIDLKFKENKVPVICKKHAISMMFFPKSVRDWLLDVLIGIGLLFLVPLFFSLAITNRFVLAIVFSLYIGVLFAAYLYILHKFMLKFAGVNSEVEALRKEIRVNNKNKQLMMNRIKKSQDETGYNLGSFDDKVSVLQQTMQETVARRQEALENFESEIRHQITADITAANKEELLSLQQQFEEKRQELSDKKEEIEQLESEIKKEYEPVFGKDLLYKQHLGSFDSFCQEHSELSVEEALAQYKSSKR